MFEELKDVGVKKIDLIVEVVANGDGSQERDEVMVTANLELSADIDDEEALLLLPLASSAQQKPLVRFVDQHVKDAFQFDADIVDRSAYDTELVERLEKMADGTSKKEEKDVLTAMRRCADGISAAVVRVMPGQRQLRIFYTVAAAKVEDLVFEFEVMGPLPSFVISPGGSISVVGILPRATTLQSAVGLQDPASPGNEITGKTEGDVGGRHVVGWFWQSDPLFKVRYRY
jgi:hypothetical protein